MSRDVFLSYLSRAITQAEILTDDAFLTDGPIPDRSDDERMIRDIGAKFVGRAIYQWDRPDNFNDPAFLAGAKARADRMHSVDPDLIFQAAIFEIVSPKVDSVAIPAWVFEDFGEQAVDRNFMHGDMLNKDGIDARRWDRESGVPDITRLETQRFFYFMAVSYMDAGVEALHFGQAYLMAMADRKKGYADWDAFLSRVRAAARTHARRGTVLIDAHVPEDAGFSFKVDNRLLFDFVSFPLRPSVNLWQKRTVNLEAWRWDTIYGKTPGGALPSGWACDRGPYLVEFDNYGVSDHPGEYQLFDTWIWGYDEISWLASLSVAKRNSFLVTAHDWIADTDPAGFLQMPGNRVLSGVVGGRFRANDSGACPEGLNAESTIHDLWIGEAVE